MNNFSPMLSLAVIVLSLCVLLGYWTWILTGRIAKWQPFRTPIGRWIAVSLIVVAAILTSQFYVPYILSPSGTVEMPMWVDDYTPVRVHYGTRQSDFFWTDKTVGQLKQNRSVVLNINGQDIFSIQIEGRQIYVNARVFAGYDNNIVPKYTTIGSLTNFSVTIDGYLDTSIPGSTYFQKLQSTVTKYKALAAPVEVNTSGLSGVPKGWTIQQGSKGLEVKDGNNIPVLILEYKNPYEITISGLFVTPLGILKIDNSKDVIFECGDSPFELGSYVVNKVSYPYSLFDIIRSERVYDLRKWKVMP